MDDENSVYDTEVQKRNTGNLPRRSRLYQALMDSSLLSPGITDFNRMKDCCLIMISPFDLWGQDRYRYTFRYRCDEDGSLTMDDGALRIFLNTHGTALCGYTELAELLHYLEYSTGESPYPVESPRIQEIHRHVEAIRDIAEAVEESPDTIQPYYAAIQEHPEYSAEDIYYCTLDEDPE